MIALDLCAGAGGLSLGLQRAGFSVLGVELDPDACRTHARYVGPCVRADLREFKARGPVDLVAGGVPCQPFSMAGKRGGLFDPRGQLYRELLRIAAEVGARAVLVENVRGALTWREPTSRKAAVQVWREDFEAAGWRVDWRLLNAADYGVPQHRRRVFLVGLRQGRFTWPPPTHGVGLFGRPYVTVRAALGLEGEYATGLKPGARGRQGMRYLDVDAPGWTVGAKGNADLLARRRDAARLLDRPATTINCDSRLLPAGHHDTMNSGAVRLDAAQMAALQGFPAGWEWGANASRQIGNAVPPPLAEAVGRAVAQALTAARSEAA